MNKFYFTQSIAYRAHSEVMVLRAAARPMEAFRKIDKKVVKKIALIVKRRVTAPTIHALLAQYPKSPTNERKIWGFFHRVLMQHYQEVHDYCVQLTGLLALAHMTSMSPNEIRMRLREWHKFKQLIYAYARDLAQRAKPPTTKPKKRR